MVEEEEEKEEGVGEGSSRLRWRMERKARAGWSLWKSELDGIFVVSVCISVTRNSLVHAK